MKTSIKRGTSSTKRCPSPVAIAGGVMSLHRGPWARVQLRVWPWAILLLAIFTAGRPTPASANIFKVPGDFDTIEAALLAAATRPAEVHAIHLGQVRFDVPNGIQMIHEFAGLTICPDPDKPEFRRVTIACGDGSRPILRVTGGATVTLRSLDLIRQGQTRENLVWLDECAVTLERCRVGSVSAEIGTEATDYANLHITTLADVTVRNCLFFAYTAGTFSRAIRAEVGGGHHLHLYHNDVADYRDAGFDIQAGAGSVVRMRNNVAVNRLGLDPEPVAYAGDIPPGAGIMSHNAVFATPLRRGPLEPLDGHVLEFAREQAGDAFRQIEWIMDPPEDPNRDFFRLVVWGLLDQVNDEDNRGVALPGGLPDPEDTPVVDDWEGDLRPAERINRGADQNLWHPARVQDADVQASDFLPFGAVCRTVDPFPCPGCYYVGPQNQPPFFEGESAGEDCRVTGQFVSLAAVRLVGEQPLSLPTIAVVRATGNSLVLSWPLTTPPLNLEATSSLTPPRMWTTPPFPTQIVGQTVTATVPSSDVQQFFRLRF